MFSCLPFLFLFQRPAVSNFLACVSSVSRCQALAVNEQVSVGVFITDSQKKEARHKSPSSFLIPSILTFFFIDCT